MAKIYDFENIEPRHILGWFKKICQIPHGSFHEKHLAEMLKEELEHAGAEVQMLSTNALYIQRKATFGHDNWPKVLLQGHLDMVQAKDDDVQIDMTTSPVKAYYDDERHWLKADGTTLGADNGIGIAMIMEILTNPKIEHGPLEALFTTGEEVDTSICINSIPEGLIKSKYYINLDSDHDNTIYYASAGVCYVPFTVPFEWEPTDNSTETFEIYFTGFAGGHSALAIHIPHINPIVFMCDKLLNFSNEISPIRLVSLNAGTAKNAIPTSGKIVIDVDPKQETKLWDYLKQQLEIAKIVAQNNDDEAVVSIKKISKSNKAASIKRTNEILFFFAFAPNDMFTMSKNGGTMFNSSNIGCVRTDNNKLVSAFLPRSFYEDDLINICKKLIMYGKKFGCEDMSYASSCDGWLTPNYQSSRLIKLWNANHKFVTGEDAFVLPNAGGLEIAGIIKKAPQMLPNAMSTGTIIFKEHSTLENCPIQSIKKIWKILTLTLKGLDK